MLTNLEESGKVINLYFLVKFSIFSLQFYLPFWDRRGRNHKVVGYTTTLAISTYHHWSCEFESRSWWSVLNTTVCDLIQPINSLEMPVPSQSHCDFPSFSVVNWLCLFVDIWVLPFPLEDCLVYGNFVITLICDGSGFLRVLRFPSANKADRHDIAEILWKLTLNTIDQPCFPFVCKKSNVYDLFLSVMLFIGVCFVLNI